MRNDDTQRSRDSIGQPPFFIVGFSRSGTTLLAALMNRHSNICVTPETRFCRGVLPCGQIDSKPRDHEFITERVFSYWRTPDLGISKSEFSGFFEQGEASYASAFDSLLKCYRAKANRSIVGEKSPIHLLYVPLLRTWYPESRIICIVRDGRDVVRSMVAAPFTHNQKSRHAAEWSYQSWLARKFEASHAEHFTTIAFEDLLLRPTETLSAVCRHIGVEFESGQLLAGDESDVVPHWEAEWKQSALSNIDASKVALWANSRPTSMDRFLTTVMRDELELRNYKLESPQGQTVFRRFGNRVLALPFRGATYRLFRSISDKLRILLCRMRLKEYK